VRWLILLGAVGAAGASAVVVGRPDGADRPEAGLAEFRAVAERKGRKAAAASALVRGELTVDEAAAQIRTVLAEEPVVLVGLRAAHPGEPDEALVRRHLAAWVRAAACQDPDRAATALRRLSEHPAG
jgi:hypothetical protein